MTIAQISRVTTPSTTIDKEAENRKEREERERSIDHVDGFLVSSSFQVRSSQSDIVAVAQRRFLQNVSCLDGFQTSKQQERGREEVQRANVPQIAERKRLARSPPLVGNSFPQTKSQCMGLGPLPVQRNVVVGCGGQGPIGERRADDRGCFVTVIAFNCGVTEREVRDHPQMTSALRGKEMPKSSG